MGSSTSFWDGPRRVGVVFEVRLEARPSEVLSDRVKARLWERLSSDVGVDEWVLLDQEDFERDGAEVTARGAGVRDYVQIQLSEEGHQVKLELEHRRGYLYFWERVRGLSRAGSGVTSAYAFKDAEINSLLSGGVPTRRPLRLRQRRLELGGVPVELEGLGRPLDLAVADLDGDQLSDYLFLFHDRLLMLRGADGAEIAVSFQHLRRSPGLSRAKTGTLVARQGEEGMTLLAHSSGYAGWLHIQMNSEGDALTIRQADENGPYVAPFVFEEELNDEATVLLASRVAGTDFFRGPFAMWTPEGIAIEPSGDIPGFYRYQRYSLKKPEVGSWETWEAFSRLDGSLCVKQLHQRDCHNVVQNVGAEFRILDFDQDGRLDILNSSAGLGDDRWRSVQDRGRGRLKYYAWKDSDTITAMTTAVGEKGRERAVVVTVDEEEKASVYLLEVRDE